MGSALVLIGTMRLFSGLCFRDKLDCCGSFFKRAAADVVILANIGRRLLVDRVVKNGVIVSLPYLKFQELLRFGLLLFLFDLVQPTLTVGKI